MTAATHARDVRPPAGSADAEVHDTASPHRVGAAGAGGIEDVVVAGAVRVRLVGATQSDRAAVEAQLGPVGPAGVGPADITLRYVDRLDGPEDMRLLGPGEVAVADDALVVLRGRFRRPARVRIALDQLGGPCELVCEHGVGRVPHLIALLNLALLDRDVLALHASAVELDGQAVVATGWSKGGKTEAVLALLAAGVRLVGDEWLHLRPDGRVSGLREPLRIWDWQLRQLPSVRARTDRRDRVRLRLLSLASAATAPRSARLATAIERQRFVDADGAVLAPRSPDPVPRGPVLLMTSAARPDIVVRPIEGREVADRMAASLAYERRPLRELADAHRFAFPHVGLPALDGASARELDLLHRRLDQAPAVEVLHPYPMDLTRLSAVLRDVVRDLS